MGIEDYLWPSERKFSEIPGAREGGIAGCCAVPVSVGALYILTNKPFVAIKYGVRFSAVVYFCTFSVYNWQHNKKARQTIQIRKAMNKSELDDPPAEVEVNTTTGSDDRNSKS